ncbi:penicillin-binding transpeptidase domain-containing protein [Amphibacillus cookii]|uniref:penicillin-binding transpeptidase domain-containing protein n=1 Tax=Amphibacillus cookii TaxID=767787 RepID=UPI001957100A|nr:penicillin-binding transpeptidase domain-containing protein [Amphibacillus cookii]MBM7539998.1 penicillin-binding protein [Amphibacillus cookii]
MKKICLLFSTLFIITLVGCSSDEEVLPEQRFETYVSFWEEQAFNDMYSMLTEEAQDNYGTDGFIERYQKIYQDLAIEDLTITYNLGEENEEEALQTTFPITVSQDSVAGEITFDAEIEMVEYINEEEERDWLVNWHPRLIFPELEEDGKIAIETTETSRGEIFDRNGDGLAINDTVYEIGIDPGQFGDNRDQEIEAIADQLTLSVDTIEATLEQDWVTDGVFVPLKILSPSDQDLLESVTSIPAVLQREATGRVYPYSEAFAHLIGYIGNITAEEIEQADPGVYGTQDQIGKRGLEQLFEERLRGTRGVRIVADNNGDRISIAETTGEPGDDIHLTIDAELQVSLFDHFEQDSGTAAALEPQSGETLALVSSPSFDPHQFTYGISQSEYDELNEDPNEPMLNRFAATYSPGSAFKPITSTIGLNEGTITPDDAVQIDGLTWSKEGWGNYSVRRVSESTGPVDLNDALVRSDNIYFAQKALAIGSEPFIEGLNTFGFGEDGFNYTYPIQPSRISNSGEIDRETLLADSGYGQGEILMSALHLAAAYTPIINDGTMIQPILDQEEEHGQAYAENLITAEDANYIQEALRHVVSSSNGTARQANIDAIELSGKTGTAELKQSLEEENAEENGWFVAYPNNYELIIAMMVEGVENKGGSGYTVEKLTAVFDDLYQ